MIIDANTSIGKIRLRVGDYLDIPLLPDSVYYSALEDTGNSLPDAASLVASYILGILSSGTHRKMGLLEVWGNQRFEQYLLFLKNTVLNPSFMASAPIPYLSQRDTITTSIPDFIEHWNTAYTSGTADEMLSGVFLQDSYWRG